jgi:hypothetical protein
VPDLRTRGHDDAERPPVHANHGNQESSHGDTSLW